MASEGTHSMIERMIRASRLDVHIFEEVEADTSATRQALSVVLAIAGWAFWAWIVHLIGTKLLPSHSTHADWGQLARTLGFAQSPGIFRVLGLVPVVGNIIFAVASIWMLVAMVVAVRQALDYTSTWRAIAVVLIGFIPYLLLMYMAFALLGALG